MIIGVHPVNAREKMGEIFLLYSFAVLMDLGKGFIFSAMTVEVSVH